MALKRGNLTEAAGKAVATSVGTELYPDSLRTRIRLLRISSAATLVIA